MERQEKDQLQDLMVRLADGDRSAFDPLYRALWPFVRRFASRALRGSPEADDAAQVALMKIFSRAAEFDTDRDALAWVLGVTAYECKTFAQKQRRRREDGGVDLSHAQNSANPEHEVIERDLEGAALEILGTLRLADIETLRAVMDGKRPDVPAATFRKRLERSIQRLRAAWRSRHGID